MKTKKSKLKSSLNLREQGQLCMLLLEANTSIESLQTDLKDLSESSEATIKELKEKLAAAKQAIKATASVL